MNWSPKDAGYTEIRTAQCHGERGDAKGIPRERLGEEQPTEGNNCYSPRNPFFTIVESRNESGSAKQVAVRTVAERKLGEAGCHSGSLESRIIAKKLRITFWHDLCSLSRLE